jgi:hypothetical protein
VFEGTCSCNERRVLRGREGKVGERGKVEGGASRLHCNGEPHLYSILGLLLSSGLILNKLLASAVVCMCRAIMRPVCSCLASCTWAPRVHLDITALPLSHTIQSSKLDTVR